MFVPFVFSMSTIGEAPFLWWFYLGLDFAKRSGSAIVAQELYCNTPPKIFGEKGRREAFDKNLVDAHYGYRLPKNRDLKTEHIYVIPEQLLNEIVKDKGSVTDAFCYLLAQPDDRLVSFFIRLIGLMENDCKEKVEGFITLMDIPSLTVAAEQKNIPVIHFEMGCWREPKYLKTAFWDLDNIYGGNTVEQRWKRFCEEQKKHKFSLLSKQECLALLLEKKNLWILEHYNRRPSKKIGLALGYTTYELISAKTHLNDSELLFRAKQYYGLENLLVRKHPGDPYGGQYPQYAAAIDHQKRSTPEFILDCETIISLVSGTGMEAILFNRKAITLLPSPSYFASGHEIEGEGKCPGEDFVSFFAFCYLIPWEYLMDVDYMRWRLTNPSEREIYYKHLEFYFQKKGLPTRLILGSPGERLEEMLELQGYKLKEKE